MPVRLATYEDLKTIAEVLAAAFDGESLNTYFFPYRKEHPADYIKAWYQIVLEKWWDYSVVWLVSYESGRDTITGCAQWERAGEGSEKFWGLSSWDPRHLMLPLTRQYLSIERAIVPNHAVGKPTSDDPKPMSKWEFGTTVFPFIEHHYVEPAHRKNHWTLDLLGVHPQHRKSGHGGNLVKWGIQRAKEDRLAAVVIMAEGLEGYYRKYGFEVFVGFAYERDLTVEEKLKDGTVVQKIIENPLRKRKIPGGGIAWTKDKDL